MNKIYLTIKKIDIECLNGQLLKIDNFKNEERVLINDIKRNYVKNNFIYGLYYKNKIIAFSIGIFNRMKNSIWIKQFFVIEHYRGMGIGEYLWINIEKIFYNAKLRHLYLIVYSSNKKGVLFWKKNGFENVRLKNYKKSFLDFRKYVIMYKLLYKK